MNVRDLITLNEGLRLKPYKDTVGKLTIGVGRNLDDVGIRHDEAMTLLDNDIQRALGYLGGYQWFAVLDDVRQAAVTDLMFNLGPTRFHAFTKFCQAMSQRDYHWASDELQNSIWHGQVGDRAKRIRRMIETGQWPALEKA